MLLTHPTVIERTLSHFGFSHIENRGNEIRCGHDDYRNKTSIRIRLDDNPYLYVNDFSDAYSGELFSFIIRAKDTNFRSVISFIKRELNIDDYALANVAVYLRGRLISSLVNAVYLHLRRYMMPLF